MESKPNKIRMFEQECRDMLEDWCVQHDIQTIRPFQCEWFESFNVVHDLYLCNGLLNKSTDLRRINSKTYACYISYDTITHKVMPQPITVINDLTRQMEIIYGI